MIRWQAADALPPLPSSTSTEDLHFTICGGQLVESLLMMSGIPFWRSFLSIQYNNQPLQICPFHLFGVSQSSRVDHLLLESTVTLSLKKKKNILSSTPIFSFNSYEMWRWKPICKGNVAIYVLVEFLDRISYCLLWTVASSARSASSPLLKEENLHVALLLTLYH